MVESRIIKDTPPRFNALEQLATPENIHRAAEIYDFIVANNLDGQGDELFEIANNELGEEAVNFLRADLDAASKLFAYLRDKVEFVVVIHSEKLGNRNRVLHDFMNGESENPILKIDSITGDKMRSLDYVALLAARMLNGTFDYKNSFYTGQKGVNDGQHRQVAEFLLQYLGYEI